MPRPNRDVTDQEIYLRLHALGQKTANITLVFDCCNSGTISRAILGGTSRGVPPDTRTPEELGREDLTAQQQELVRSAHRGVARNPWFPLSDRYVLLASCRDEEQSFEYPPQPGPNDTVQGTLTYFLHQELIKAGPGTTYRDVFERVQRLVNAASPEQHPQMEGTRDRELFGLRDFQPMRFVKVTGRQGEQVHLAAGAAHGLTVGSLWAIYPQGTREVSPQAEQLAQARISLVRGQTSEATITQAANRAAVGEDCRAFEVEHDYGELAMRVGLVNGVPQRQADADDLAKRIDGSQMLRRSQQGERVDVLVSLSRRDSVEPTWSIIGGGDELLAPPRPASQPNATAVVLDNLEKIARYRNLLAIKNPSPINPLDKKIQFTLLRQGAGGKWVEAGGEGMGMPVYRVGERIAFRIRHDFSRELYIHILDFGLASGVSLAYPVEGSNERHEPNQTVESGSLDNREIYVCMPEEFQREEGTETLKLIATTDEVDFSWMKQAGVKALTLKKPSLLEEMLRRAAFQTRGETPKVPAAEEWITIDRSFLVKRA
jgi:hypothetical protein